MDTAEITLTIPTSWLEGVATTQDVLQHALKLGLDQLRQQDAHDSAKVIQALLRTGRVSHLTSSLDDTVDETTGTRQTPPVIEGPSVSDILIAQRKGEE